MRSVKYTREMLSEAVAASTSMAGVLRHLGLRQTGGTHAHLRRRITALGIDTAHFLGSGHFRGIPSRNRRDAGQILVLRPSNASRAKPRVLRRALIEIGRPYQCTECGNGDTWNGRPLVLHVDHIDGRLWDCRPENVRFLCPNCHSQTSTYAGRTSLRAPATLIQVDDEGNPVAHVPPPVPPTEGEVLRVLERVQRTEIGSSQAARLIGCSPSQIYRLQKRLADSGSITPATRRPPLSAAERTAIVAVASAHPELGMRQQAQALRDIQPGPIDVSSTTIARVLAEETGHSAADRRAAVARRAKDGITV